MEGKRRRTARMTTAPEGSSSGRSGCVLKTYDFEFALSDEATLGLTVRNPPKNMLVSSALDKVREKFNAALEKSRLEPEAIRRRNKMFWRGRDVHLVGERRRMAGRTYFKDLEPSRCYLLSLSDRVPSGGAQSRDDLNPGADLFLNTEEKYDTETALTELIDKSVCAVMSGKNQRLVSLDINEDSISLFDTGDGIDGSGVNSIVNWGRPNPTRLAPGGRRGRPPYLRSTLGRAGYGAYKASLSLGRHSLISSKTKESNKIFMLHFGWATLHEQGASCSDFCWKLLTSAQSNSDVIDSFLGDLLDPSQKSFKRIEVFDHVCKVPDKFLPCRIKDIYFPFIQSDDVSAQGRTSTLVTFQVNGVSLAELEGGQVATMNLHSSNGPEFVVQLHFSINKDKTEQRNPGVQGLSEANARLKCVYFPAVRGKEIIKQIMKNESFKKVYKSDTLSHIYVRWLGRLLTRTHWDGLPFMEPRPNMRTDYQVLKRCCRRVVCFIDTDGGFVSTPLKTNLREDLPFTRALKNLGACLEDVNIDVFVSGKKLDLQTLETEYKNWVFQMHDRYDVEHIGVDEAILLLDPSNTEELKFSSKVIRVHKVLVRDDKTWKYGQRVKILKGTVPGYQKTNFYATLEYFLLEGLDGDAEGEARVTCRPLGVEENGGCVLISDGNPTLDLRSSLSLPIFVVDSGKCLDVSADEWNQEIESRRLLLNMPREKQSITQGQYLMLDMGDSLPISSKKRAHAEIKAAIRQWKLLSFNGQPFIVRMGSCFPPFSVAGYDAYENSVPFDSAPEVLIEVESEKGEMICQVDKFIPELSSDKKIINVKNICIKASDIDKLRPSYEATLFLCKCDKSLELQVPCRFMPGPLDQVLLLSSDQSTELHPGYVFKDVKLEVLDAYGNHIEEGFEVTLSLDGMQMLDCPGLNFMVDSQGYINLGGHLKVTAGYGESVSLSVLVIDKVVFTKEFHIGKRELRILSKVPEICHPGSKIRNLVFEIINSDGIVDENVHDQNKDGLSHLLRLDVQLAENLSSELFAFQNGKCTVPSIALPRKEGWCWIVATHTNHPELCLRVKVKIAQAPKSEPTNSPCGFQSVMDKHDKVTRGVVKVEQDMTIPDLQAPIDQHVITTPPCNYDSVTPFDCSYTPLMMVNNMETCEFLNLKDLETEIRNCGIQIHNHELDLKILSSRKEVTRKDMSSLKDYVSKKEHIEKLIDSKVGSVAAYYCNFSRTKKREESNKTATDMLGLVALLGTAPCQSLARTLSEYLGEDQMLAVVCTSNLGGILHRYEDMLGFLEAKSCRGQQLYICLEDVRPYTGGIIQGDQQRRLALPGPLLNSGMTPLGFKGYAVNMIDISLEHMDTRVGELGYGLRETLFYHLFGELQVYDNREHLKAAWSCIKSDAVSLDGGIVKRNGTILLSVSEPEICFPVLSLNQPIDGGTTDIHRLIEAKGSSLDLFRAAEEVQEYQLASRKKMLDEKLNQYYQLFGPLESLCKYSLFPTTQEQTALWLPSSSNQLPDLPERKPDTLS